MKQRYVCYLNGKLYGMGDLNYMNELFKDYVVDCQMKGKEEVTFQIVDREQVKCNKCGSFNFEDTTFKDGDRNVLLKLRSCLKCEHTETIIDETR